MTETTPLTAAIDHAAEAVLDLIEHHRAEARLLTESADRLYRALAIFDTRDGTYEANVARAAREGYERSAPGMAEPEAWDELDRLLTKRS